MQQEVEAPAAQVSSHAVHVETVWNGAQTCRWIEVVHPAVRKGEGSPALLEALQQLRAEGVCLSEEMLAQMTHRNARAALHQCDTQALAFVLHAIHVSPRAHTRMLQVHEIEMVIGADYLLMVHGALSSPAVSELRALWRRESGNPGSPAAHLGYRVVKALMSDYHEALDSVPMVLERLEEQVGGNITQEHLQGITADIFHLNHMLLELRKYFGPLRRLLDRLYEISEDDGTPLPCSLASCRMEFYDLRTQVEHLIELVDTYRDMVTNVLGAYQSATSNYLAVVSNQMTDFSNRMNENMQRITVIATILSTASALTGLYGVNLSGLGLKSESLYGAPLLLVVMIVIGVVEFLIFKKKGWI